jgi:hypothetical protein
MAYPTIGLITSVVASKSVDEVPGVKKAQNVKKGTSPPNIPRKFFK